MKDNREIEQLFSKKLKGFEADVNPELWGNISSQIGVATTPIVGGVSAIAKTIIVAASFIVILGVVYFSKTVKKAPLTKVTTQTKVKVIESNKINIEVTPESVVKSVAQNNEIAEDDITIFLPQENTINNEEEILPPDIVHEIVMLIEEDNTPIIIVPQKEEQIVPGEEQIEEIILAEEPIIEAGYFIEKMPDVFSPNNDGVNDNFFIKSEGLSDFNVVIMNSRNETVFQSEEPNFTWDGTSLNGDQVEEGKYVYFVIAKDRNGIIVNKHSLLTVVR